MRILCCVLSFAVGLVPCGAIARSQSHCKSFETDFFSCKIAKSNKVVSLCGKSDTEHTEDYWLQYRFGIPGQPEMIYPTSKNSSFEAFHGRHQVGGAYYQYDVWFHPDNYRYSVSASSTDNEPGKINVYIYYQEVRNLKHQGVLNCSQPSRLLLDRLDALSSNLKIESDSEE